ncbi:unnamed protein product [Zymoseptoria tritici ST99CH_1E4]|uniref:Transmembrane protein n=1 Tax=Zymoseptoria tritici ST99CH_1E4 TaxID=1276532 RepID=A0A2H1H9C8_ZYMTR|nr:unnamed protein product [Zymoseptoria tritici ST99CH_1E4]
MDTTFSGSGSGQLLHKSPGKKSGHSIPMQEMARQRRREMINKQTNQSNHLPPRNHTHKLALVHIIIPVLIVLVGCIVLVGWRIDQNRLRFETSHDHPLIATLPATTHNFTGLDLDLRQIVSGIPVSNITQIHMYPFIWKETQRTIRQVEMYVTRFRGTCAASASRYNDPLREALEADALARATEGWDGRFLRDLDWVELPFLRSFLRSCWEGGRTMVAIEDAIKNSRRRFPGTIAKIEASFQTLAEAYRTTAELFRALQEGPLEFAAKVAQEGDEGYVDDFRHVLGRCVARVESAVEEVNDGGTAWRIEAETDTDGVE